MNEREMQGKICLITGATGGIGVETALGLAKQGAQVIIAGRSAEKIAAAARRIEAESGAAVQTLTADLSSQAEVRRLAAEFSQRWDRLDVLVNNAGAIFVNRRETVDGLEMTFALNHLNYFLLTHLLLDCLKAAGSARIVNVSSGAHLGGKINFDDLQLQRGYSSWKAYSQSKLANVLFTYELARKLAGSGITANALHPGFVATNFGRSNGGLFNPLFRLTQVFAITPEAGARTSIYLASSPEVAGVTGKYFDRCRPVRSSPLSYNEETARRLWQVSLQLTGLQEG